MTITPDLTGLRVAALVADGYEPIELTAPVEGLRGAGATVIIVGLAAGDVQGVHRFERAGTVRVDVVVDEVAATDFDALLLPGGVKNPDLVRQSEPAVRFVRDMWVARKPIAAICHAPWTLVEADVVRGRRLTSYPSLRTDIRNAGGTWVDAAVVVDGNLVTSRNPGDIPVFTETLLATFAEARRPETAAEHVH
jgi:protease I